MGSAIRVGSSRDKRSMTSSGDESNKKSEISCIPRRMMTDAEARELWRLPSHINVQIHIERCHVTPGSVAMLVARTRGTRPATSWSARQSQRLSPTTLPLLRRSMTRARTGSCLSGVRGAGSGDTGSEDDGEGTTAAPGAGVTSGCERRRAARQSVPREA